jgi:MFS family permease
VANPTGPLGRSYWRLWSSAGLSNLADGVLKTALPLIAIQFTTDPRLIAGVALAGSLPWLLFALQAGAISDRHDRRRIMVGANTVRAALLGVLAVAVATDAAGIYLLYAIAFLLGICETLYDTSAQSILPQVVERDQLSRANSRLYSVELTANEFIGPPLAGVLVALGAALALAGSSAAWFLAALALFFLRGSFRTDHPRTSTIRADVAEGLRFLAHHRVLRGLAILTGVSNLAGAAVFSVFVLFAVGPDSPMGLTEPQYGLLLTSTAIGALIGTLIADRVERRVGRTATLLIMVLVGGGELMLPALTTNPWILASGYVLVGMVVVMGNVVMVSFRQRITPDRLLGRVNSAYRLVAWGTMPLGAVLGGVIADAIGLRPLFVIASVIALSPLLLFIRVLNEDNFRRAEEESGQ